MIPICNITTMVVTPEELERVTDILARNTIRVFISSGISGWYSTKRTTLILVITKEELQFGSKIFHTEVFSNYRFATDIARLLSMLKFNISVAEKTMRDVGLIKAENRKENIGEDAVAYEEPNDVGEDEEDVRVPVGQGQEIVERVIRVPRPAPEMFPPIGEA